MAPSVYMREWSAEDRALAEGLLTLEATTGQYGEDLMVAFDSRDKGEWTVEAEVNRAAGAVERWKSEAGKHMPEGTIPIVKYQAVEDEMS